MADRRRRDVRDEAKRKRGMLCEDATVEAATVESNDAVQRSDELNKQDSAGNQLPAEGLPCASEPEEKTHFERVDAVARPAVSKGKRKNSLRWKTDSPNRQTTESTTLEETVTQDQGETQDDSGTANERTKFEMVAVESRPAVSKHRRKNLKWKDSDKEVLSRSVRALELIRNAELVDGTLSDKENASVAAFFANPAILRTHTKRLVSKALGSAMDRLKEISTDEDLKQFFEDRPSAIDDMFQELLNNRALLPSCWILTEGMHSIFIAGPEKMKTVAKTPKSKETKGNIEAENATQRTRASTLSKAKELEETKEVVKSTDETRGVRKVLELATPWGRRRKSWRKSDRSHRSEKSRKSEKRGRPQKEEEQTKQQQKATELDEREKKAWQETEAERRSFLAFALPAAYRFFNWK
ncbi:unnamed protein product [Toxocara canis]|uniref:Transmembrane protein n=1 Tax=Toxocara canis TaxID=6265 RepID=A0A183UYN3_TOXCA|nr:unnamed protein product [Toxocara canis]